MEIRITRTTKTPESTIGTMSINGVHECYTLEDTIRDKKIHGKTAIPAGRYQVVLTFSNKFQKYLPLLLNVPNFEGIRIHPGNKATDSDGCILVGVDKGKDFIGQSQVAFKKFMAKFESAIKKEKIFITIV